MLQTLGIRHYGPVCDVLETGPYSGPVWITRYLTRKLSYTKNQEVLIFSCGVMKIKKDSLALPPVFACSFAVCQSSHYDDN